MKSLRIGTAATLLLMSALAPVALAVGDPNTDTGFGSAASRGPFGFSNNNDVMYDTPANSYGVYRDANGGLRDRGMIPDNLTTHVPEPTWEESHRNKFMVPGGGAVGGLGGGGGFGGGVGLGGLGGLGYGAAALGGLGGAGVLGGLGGVGGIAGGTNAGFGGLGGLGFGGLGFAGLGSAGSFQGGSLGFAGNAYGNLSMRGTGGTAQALRTNLGFLGSPNNSSYNAFPSMNQRFLGPGTGFLPNYQLSVNNRVLPGGGNVLTYSQNTPSGLVQQTVTIRRDPGAPGQSNITQTWQYNGNTYTSNQRVPTSSLAADTAFNSNFNSTVNLNSNNGYTNPFVQNNPNNVQSSSTGFSSGTIGGGFATPQTSGNQRSVMFNDSLGSNSIGGGFSSPSTSGNERSVMFNADATGTIGGGFATPATSGSERSIAFPNLNSGVGPGGFGGFGGLGGYGGVGGLGGISAGTGNRADRENLANGSGSDNNGGFSDDKSDGSISGTRTGGTGANYNGAAGGSGGSNGTGGGISLGNNLSGFLATGGTLNSVGAGLPGNGGNGHFGAGVYGPITPGGGPAIGTMGERMASGAGEVLAYPPIKGLYQRVYPRTANGAVRDFMKETPLANYVRAKIAQTRSMNQGVAIAGDMTSGNIATDLEYKLAKMHLTPSQAIGRVIGCMRYTNGDITTFGSKGTLHLARDNSGSISFNSGEVLTFRHAPRAMREIALRSTQIF